MIESLPEGRGVVTLAVYGCSLARHTLDHHGDGHAGGEAVGVEQDVGEEAALRPGEVLYGPLLAADTCVGF